MNKQYIWRFEGNTDVPTYDPWFDAKCMVSWKQLVRWSVYTISVMGESSNRSYFFRVLKEEWDKLTDTEKNMYESSIIDNEKILKGED